MSMTQGLNIVCKFDFINSPRSTYEMACLTLDSGVYDSR